MPIRRRISNNQVSNAEVSQATVRQRATGDDVFTALGIPQGYRRIFALRVGMSGNLPLPKDMPADDLLAAVRIPNNPGDHIEERYRNRIRSSLTAIRSFCVECQGGQPGAVNKCADVSCPLWPYRMGNNSLSRSSKRS